MQIILFDSGNRQALFPLSLTRAIGHIRSGIFTQVDRWKKLTELPVGTFSEAYLENKPVVYRGECLVVDAALVPDRKVIDKLLSINLQEAFVDEKGLVAGMAIIDHDVSFQNLLSLFSTIEKVSAVTRFEHPSDFFKWNDIALHFDFDLITSKRQSSTAATSVVLINPDRIFIEESATLCHCILNATDGPIYIGPNTEIMEGCLVRGPFALCEGAKLKMGSKIYGATTIGPYCVAGGEIKNSIMMGYSNKAHDGYLGDSIIGEWCNLGAGTSNSNVKNTGSEVKVWDALRKDFVSAGLKCGLIMGDYSRAAINTSFNTGTVVGVCCNIFEEGLTPKIIPSFTWGNKELSSYELDKALKDIANWKSLKNQVFTSNDQKVVQYVFENYND